MNIDDETNACRILNERHAAEDAQADADERLFDELYKAAIAGLADKPMGVEDITVYSGHDWTKDKGKPIYIKRDGTLCELLGYTEESGKIAAKALILCAKKGDVDAIEGIRSLIRHYIQER